MAATVTLIQAQAQLASYLAAETAVLNGQEYTIGVRRLRRADLKEIRDGITYWNRMVSRLAGGGGLNIRGATPV